MSQQRTEWILDLKDMMSSKLNSIDKDVKDVQDDFKDLKKEIETPDTSGLDDIKKGATESGMAFDDAADTALELFGNINGTGAGAATAVLHGVTGGIKSMTKAGIAFITTPIGAAIAGLAVIGIATKEWIEFNNVAAEANSQVQAITQAGDDALSGLRVRAQALEATFGGDWEDHLRMVNSLQKGFKISSEEAFEVYQDGMIRGGRANDEFASSIREYPKLFNQGMFTAREFLSVINDSAAIGTWSDKLPDAVKEFGIELNNQTQPARDALENAFGKKFTDELFRNVRNGSMSTRDALAQVSAETKRVNLNRQQEAQLTSDLFKAAGEDSGGLVEVLGVVDSALNRNVRSLTAVEQKLNDTALMNLKLKESQAKALESESYKAFAQEVSLTWKAVQVGFYKTISAITDGYDFFKKISSGFIGGVSEVFDNFEDLIFGSVLDIKDSIMDLVDSVTSVGSIWDALLDGDVSGAIDEAKKWKDGVVDQFADVKQTAKEARDDVKGVFDEGFINAYNDETAKSKALAAGFDQENPTDLNLGSGGTGRGSGSGLGIDGGNGGGGKIINMKLDIQNVFHVADAKRADLERLADQVIGRVVDRLRDSAIAIG